MANNVYSNYQEANAMDKGNRYKLAALNNRDELLKDILKYENENDQENRTGRSSDCLHGRIRPLKTIMGLPKAAPLLFLQLSGKIPHFVELQSIFAAG